MLFRKKDTQQTFASLASSYQPISAIHQTEITGGGVDANALFYDLFDISSFSTQVNINLALYKDDFAKLVSTSLGLAIVEGLIASGKQIKLDNSQPVDDDGHKVLGAYNSDTQTIQIGGLASSFVDFSVVAHELYHAYTDLALEAGDDYFFDVRSELDAGMFAYATAIQYDKDHGLSNTAPQALVNHAVNYGSYINGMDPAANNAFKQAWDDIFVNGNFSYENYNEMIATFDNGSYYGVKMPGGTADMDHAVVTLNETYLDNLFSEYFSTYYTGIQTSNSDASAGSDGGVDGSASDSDSADESFSYAYVSYISLDYDSNDWGYDLIWESDEGPGEGSGAGQLGGHLYFDENWNYLGYDRTWPSNTTSGSSNSNNISDSDGSSGSSDESDGGYDYSY